MRPDLIWERTHTKTRREVGGGGCEGRGGGWGGNGEMYAGPMALRRAQEKRRGRVAIAVGLVLAPLMLVAWLLPDESWGLRDDEVAFFIDTSVDPPVVVGAEISYSLDPGELRSLRRSRRWHGQPAGSLAVGAVRDPLDEAAVDLLVARPLLRVKNRFEDPDTPGKLADRPVGDEEWAEVREALRAYLTSARPEVDRGELDPGLVRTLLHDLDAPAYAWRVQWGQLARVLMYVGLFLFAGWSCVVGWRDKRWEERMRGGLCVHCGYDLEGSRGACPECGRTWTGKRADE